MYTCLGSWQVQFPKPALAVKVNKKENALLGTWRGAYTCVLSVLVSLWLWSLIESKRFTANLHEKPFGRREKSELVYLLLQQESKEKKNVSTWDGIEANSTFCIVNEDGDFQAF